MQNAPSTCSQALKPESGTAVRAFVAAISVSSLWPAMFPSIWSKEDGFASGGSVQLLSNQLIPRKFTDVRRDYFGQLGAQEI